MTKFIKRNWKLILGVLYLLSPIDIIPDFLVPFGSGDDLLVAIFTLISRYRDFRKELKAEEKLKNSQIVEGEIVTDK